MNLIHAATDVLRQAKSFLSQIKQEEYTQPVGMLSDSTIGAHTRHFIEFYQCLLAQVAHQEINYCLRERDFKIENSAHVAIESIDTIIQQLQDLDLDLPLILVTEKQEGQKIKTTLGRELYYNMEHCIHHLALIKVGIKCVCPDIKLPKEFGLAPSTISHQKIMTQQ